MSATLTMAAAAESRLAPDDQIEGMIQAAIQGDRTALGEVVVAVERRVYKFAWRLIGDPTAAEDITQEVLIKIARNLGRYRPGSNLWAWIYRIVVNQVHDYRRGNALRPEILPVAAGYDPELQEQLGRIQEALAILTPKEREAIILLEVEGYTSREAASILGSLAITVRTRAAHARKKLRQHLSRYYPELGEKP